MTDMLKMYSGTKISFLSGAEISISKQEKGLERALVLDQRALNTPSQEDSVFFLVGNEYLFEGFKLME